MAFSFDKELLTLIGEKAKSQGSGLNEYLELLMLKDVDKIPNAETKKAINAAMEGDLERIKNLNVWLENL